MPLVCIQCSMRAMLEDKPSPTFEGTNEEHLAKYHPDLAAAQAERQDLERKLAEKFAAKFAGKD